MINMGFAPAVLIAVLLSPSEALAGRLAQLEVATEKATYQVRVDQENEFGSGRTLIIECTKRCSNFSIYREKVDATPLGFFRLTDAYPLLISTWSEGTTTKIRIYKLDSEGVELVFDQYTLGTPTIEPKGGVLSVSVSQYVGGGAGNHRKIIDRTWSWKNHRFLLMSH
jgi:hypothetical protein